MRAVAQARPAAGADRAPDGMLPRARARHLAPTRPAAGEGARAHRSWTADAGARYAGAFRRARRARLDRRGGGLRRASGGFARRLCRRRDMMSPAEIAEVNRRIDLRKLA